MQSTTMSQGLRINNPYPPAGSSSTFTSPARQSPYGAAYSARASPAGPRPSSIVGPRAIPTPPRAGSQPRPTQPLFQPTFALRPTHSRSSPIKPYPASAGSPGHYTHDMKSPSKSLAGSSLRSHTRTDSDLAELIPEVHKSSDQISRKVSTSTTGTGHGSGSTPLGTAKSKASGVLRRISRSCSDQTISGGPYIPLQDQEIIIGDTPEPTTPKAERIEPSRSNTISSLLVTPARSVQHSVVPTPSTEGTTSRHPQETPTPPHHIPYRRPSTAPSTRMMSRSASTPHHLSNIPEVSSIYSRQHSISQQQQQQHTSGTITEKRYSDPASGVHSQNAALFQAESGGVTLSYDNTNGQYASHQFNEPMMNQRQPFQQHLVEVDDVRSRPWSDSTMSNHHHVMPSHVRSLSEGAMLARQGTLLHPASDPTRKSQELGVLLGNRNRKSSQGRLLPPPELTAWQQAGGEGGDQIRIEAAKKKKARVEVDVVLERECVVEGGEIRGRMDVFVAGGKRGEGLRVGGGKIRVIGFEDINAESRHIFYHVPHPLPLFAHPPLENGPTSSLFASYPNDEGYRLVHEGAHSIPFRLRLPLNGGAKGAFMAQKGPAVRYVVVGSIKLLMTSTGKRSIAHFYRTIVVLPYLNPGIVLAPSEVPISAVAEKGLGWNIMGEKGKVEMRLALGRKYWVAGQRAWFEIGIRNDSTRKIKSLHFALLQTIQTFHPDATVDAFSTQSGEISCVRRKVAEEVVDADFPEHGAGRVTSRDWWTGVEAGERGHWDMSIYIPPGLLSIPRTRLIEVSYTLRVTANTSVYVDLPITLINFLSIDPPPMPGDGFRSAPKVSQTIPLAAPANPPHATVIINREPLYNSNSDNNSASVSVDHSPHLAARASSTTLHIDALLAAGRERAAAEQQLPALPSVLPYASDTRRGSLGSSYASDPSPALSPPPKPLARPKPNRVISYFSVRSAFTDGQAQSPNAEEEEEEDEEAMNEEDRALLQAARRRGRIMSLAAIERAMERRQADYDDGNGTTGGGGDVVSEGHPSSSHVNTPIGANRFAPLDTPMEEVYQLVQDTPRLSEMGKTPVAGGDSRSTLDTPMHQKTEEESLGLQVNQGHISAGNHISSAEGDIGGPSTGESQSAKSSFDIDPYARDDNDHQEHLADQTIVEDLLPQTQAHSETSEAFGYDYGEEVEATPNPAMPSLEPPVNQDAVSASMTRRGTSNSLMPNDRDEHIKGTRSIYGSFAQSVLSEQESELGVVTNAIKRTLSIRLPPAPSFDFEDDGQKAGRSGSEPFLAPLGAKLKDDPPDSLRRGSSSPRAGTGTGDGSPRKAGSSITGVYGNGISRGSAASIPSPLKTVEEVPSPELPSQEGAEKLPVVGKLWANRPSFSFNTPAPLKIRDGSLSPHAPPGQSSGFTSSSPGPSPRTVQPSTMDLGPPNSYSMSRKASGTSALRNQLTLETGSISSGEDLSPGLAPSNASDGDSSDGNCLESPPFRSAPQASSAELVPSTEVIGTSEEQAEKPLPALPTLDKDIAAVSALLKDIPAVYSDGPMVYKSSAEEQSWRPGSHLRNIAVNRVETASAIPPSMTNMTLPPISPISPFYAPELTKSSSNQGQGQGQKQIPKDELPPTSPDTQSHQSHSSTSSHSIMLPSMRAKLTQLENRSEALRKFSVASAASGQSYAQNTMNPIPIPPVPRGSLGGGGLISARPSISVNTGGARPSVSSLAGNHGHIPSPLGTVRKRTSYTAALAPRPIRSHSDDIIDGSLHSPGNDPNGSLRSRMTLQISPPVGVGGTTYLSRRMYSDPWGGNKNNSDNEGPISPEVAASSNGVYDLYGIGNMSPVYSASQIASPISPVSATPSGIPVPGRWKLERSMSGSSVSTTATNIEHALMNHSQGQANRPLGPRSPATAPSGSRPGTSMAGVYGPSASGQLGYGSPRGIGGYTTSIPIPGRDRRLGSVGGGETDDSDGLL